MTLVVSSENIVIVVPEKAPKDPSEVDSSDSEDHQHVFDNEVKELADSKHFSRLTVFEG